MTSTPVRRAADPAVVAARFHRPGSVSAVAPLGSGNVNDTFLVSLEGSEARHAVLQRLNTRVFPHPRAVMANIAAVGEHVTRRLAASPAELQGRRWVMPRALPAREGGEPWHEEEDGSFWRSLTFVEDATTLDVIAGEEHAREVGTGLGLFHLLIHDLPPELLSDTLEGFHVTPRYLATYRRVLERVRVDTGTPEAWCRSFIREREGLAPVLEEALARGELRLRPIHGDPKINNVLLDARDGRACALVDLDTVKPGLVQWDIGDCLRSGCNPLGEETTDPDGVHFDLPLAEALLGGYLTVARSFLGEADYRYLYDAIRLIAFELGLRFFTDHLAGDVYFRASHRGHNLRRALVQFRLVESIEAQEQALRSLVERLR